jgi:hypothetical protein
MSIKPTVTLGDDIFEPNQSIAEEAFASHTSPNQPNAKHAAGDVPMRHTGTINGRFKDSRSFDQKEVLHRSVQGAKMVYESQSSFFKAAHLKVEELKINVPRLKWITDGVKEQSSVPAAHINLEVHVL